MDGLDLELVPGLNVLIGARGTGKTSVIELIRFALDIPFLTSKVKSKSSEQAAFVLADGRVTVTTETGGEVVKFTRAAGESASTLSPSIPIAKPTILSQDEIEAVAGDVVGRLQLVDGPDAVASRVDPEESSLLGAIASVTSEMHGLGRQIDSVEQQMEALAEVPDQLEAVRSEEALLASTIAGMSAERERLQTITDELAGGSVRKDLYERVGHSLFDWRSRIATLVQTAPSIEAWPDAAGGADSMARIREALEASIRHLSEAVEALDASLEFLESLSKTNDAEQIERQDEARRLRKMVEEVQQGAGALSRRVADLTERAGQLSALNELRGSLTARLTQLGEQRAASLDELDAHRATRSARRLETCDELTRELGPRIRIRLEQGGMRTGYVSALSSAMRGSGLHYNVLAPLLARELSPRELVESIELGDSERLATLAAISQDRAQRLVAFVADKGTEAILTAPIDDGVELSLLDGREYKPSDHLSTGQRCTVVLPILLARHREGLIIDQPEDNLDNAFITETLIQAIQVVAEASQLVFATHNANIPVLGDAARVTRLGSDGDRGFVLESGPLDAPQVVHAITSVMEGGYEAFRRRADFYESRIPAR